MNNLALQDARLPTGTAQDLIQTQPANPVHRLGQEQASPSPSGADPRLVHAVSELKKRAYKNAPRCAGRNSHLVQEWMTLSQASETFRMSKRTLCTWVNQGLIASLKGEGTNSRRLVHIDNILAHMEDQLQDLVTLETCDLQENNDEASKYDRPDGIMQQDSMPDGSSHARVSVSLLTPVIKS